MMKLVKIFITAILASAYLHAANNILPWDSFTDVKRKLAQGILSGTATESQTVTGTSALTLTYSTFGTIILDSETALRLQTPAVNASTAAVGQTLKLSNVNGTVEFGAPYTYFGSKTFDTPNLTTLASTSTTVTVTGATVGKTAVASLSTLTTQGVMVSASVSAADTVTVFLFNATGSAIDLASGTLKAVVFD